jgi:phosphoribosylformylglycinamidine synthase
MTPKIGVILFPGTNCELEALRACKRSNMQPELFRWNDDRKKLKNYDGYIIPGGFSYEDRSRSGVIASKDPIMEVIKMEAEKGKPVIGVCNGAQILVETGLIPGITLEHLEMALAWNERTKKGKILGVGFYNDWIQIRSDAKPGRSVFNNFSNKVIMRIPVAHGEGRFTTQEKELLQNLIKNQQTLFRYCDKNGKFDPEFPVNPNGALYNLAGVCNPQGNVLALMPHPERTIYGQPIFDSMAKHIVSRKKLPPVKSAKKPTLFKEKIERMAKKPDIVIKVELIITDNEERTIENTIKKIGFKDAGLKRKLYFGFYTKNKSDLRRLAQKLIESGEILNLHKEIPTATIEEIEYAYEKQSGLVKKVDATPKNSFNCLTADYDNYSGKSVKNKLQPYFKNGEIVNVIRGTHWEIKVKKADEARKILSTHILHNPHSMKLIALT